MILVFDLYFGGLDASLADGKSCNTKNEKSTWLASLIDQNKEIVKLNNKLLCKRMSPIKLLASKPRIYNPG